MDKIDRSHIVSGLIGGLTFALIARFAIRRRFKRMMGKRGGCGPWGSKCDGIESLHSSRLPAAIGPYSYGKKITNGCWVMGITSGQIGVVPETGLLVSEDDVAQQAEQALTNLRNLAEDNGFNLATDTTKCTLYLTDMNDFAVVNTVYAKFFA